MGAKHAPIRVVVVDDSAAQRETASAPFIARGDNVRCCEHGMVAIAACIKEPPDVILSDVQLPTMDGWQLLRLVRSRPELAAVPFVFLTTLDSDSDRWRGYHLGVDLYMAKPYRPDQMMAKVHQLVKRSRRTKDAAAEAVTLRGDLDHVKPVSLFSFLEAERQSGALMILGDQVGRVLLLEGVIVSAELAGSDAAVDPREALRQILDWTTGQFEFSPQEVEKTELVINVTPFLLNHVREQDEEGRPSLRPPGR